MTSRLYGQIANNFFKTPLSRNSQKETRAQRKTKQTKNMTRKCWSLVRILMYRTWAIPIPKGDVQQILTTQ